MLCGSVLLLFAIIVGTNLGFEENEMEELLGNNTTSVMPDSDSDDSDEDNFALNILRLGTPSGENAIISPISISLALSMTAAGAKGATARQLRAAIAKGRTDEELYEFFHGILNLNESDNALYQLSLVNRLYIKEGLDIVDKYKEIINDYYEGQLESADFNDSATVAQEINDFVETNTNSKIRNLVRPEMFNELTQMVIINAVYFKGLWKNEFRNADTDEGIFHISEGDSRKVDMMHAKKFYLYTETDDLKMLAMRYIGSHDLYMLAFLPKERFGLEKLERDLTVSKMFEIFHNSTDEEVLVAMPKFKFEKGMKLVEVLKAMGIEDAFNDKADFSGISASPLVISDIVHKAFISVDEKGTEAAGVTGVIYMTLSAIQSLIPPKEFIADHPFLFAIVHKNTILFIGRLCTIG